VPACEEEEK